MLGWKLYIPYGSQAEQYEYYGSARIASLDCESPDDVIDREYGCYGLLSEKEGEWPPPFPETAYHCAMRWPVA